MAELNEEISKLNTETALLQSTISDLGCSEKTNSNWNEKWSYEGQYTEKSNYWETEGIGKNPCKKNGKWEKRFAISDKMFSSANLFLFLLP